MTPNFMQPCIPNPNQHKIRKFCRGSPSHHSYKVSKVFTCSFREDVWKSAHQNQELPQVSMFFIQLAWNQDLPYIIPVKFGSIWPSGFRGEDENVKS